LFSALIEKAAHPEPQRVRTFDVIAAAHTAGQTALYGLALAAWPPLKKNENAGCCFVGAKGC
jgi:hypothetical protein